MGAVEVWLCVVECIVEAEGGAGDCNLSRAPLWWWWGEVVLGHRGMVGLGELRLMGVLKGVGGGALWLLGLVLAVCRDRVLGLCAEVCELAAWI